MDRIRASTSVSSGFGELCRVVEPRQNQCTQRTMKLATCIPTNQQVSESMRALEVFTNQDGSTGTLYLACRDLTCEGPTVEAIYQKRWNVETFHKTLKSHAALAKSPTKRVRTQSNHCFMALYAASRLEGLRIKHRLNHFARRSRLYLKAIRCAFEELQTLKTA